MLDSLTSQMFATDRYKTKIDTQYGLKINDRVLVDGKRIGTLLALTADKKFTLLSRFLIRLDPINQKEQQAPESLFIEVYISQVQIAGG